MFNWANSQLEKLSETLAPQPTTPTPRFIAALSSFNEQLALEILNDQNPANQQLDIYNPIKPNGLCAIHLAAQYGAIQVLKCLIFQRGIIVDTTLDTFGYTALHHASSTKQITPQQSLLIVKFLVEECNSSVILKSNSQSGYQTPYDVATSQAVRGYLLPKQLQAETILEEERLKNEGNHVTQIAPPPTMPSGGMNMGGNSMQGQGSSGGMSAVDMLMQPTSGVVPTQPQVHNSAMSSSAHNNDMSSMPPMPPVNNNMMPPSPAATNQPPQQQMGMVMSPQPVNNNVSAVMESSSLAVQQQAPQNINNTSVSTIQPAKLTSLGGLPPPPNMVSTLQSHVKAVNNQQPVVVAAPQQQQTSPVTTPRMEAPKSSNSTPSAAPSAPSSNNTTPRQPAPSSGGQHSYARRGGQNNTAAVLQNSKYKPDGFHSSSNDKELQAKYGHVNVTSNVAPPPMSGNSSIGMPPNSGNANSGGQPPSSGGSNPYSATSNPFAAPPRSTGYITSTTNSNGPNRYPAYCAVSNSVSLIGGQQHYNSAPNSSGSGHVGIMQQQPVVPSYATFNPAAVMNNNNATSTPAGFSNQQLAAPNSGGIMPQQTSVYQSESSPGIQQMPPNNNAMPPNNNFMPQTAYQSSAAPVNTNMGMPPSGQMSYNAAGATTPNNNNAMQGIPQGQQQQAPPNNVSATQAFDQPPINNQVDANQLFNSTPSLAVNNNTDTADQLFSTTPAITEQQQVNGTDGQTTAVLEGVNDNMTQPPTTASENEQTNDQQTQVDGLTTDKNDTAADNIEDEIPNDGSEEISGEMQSIQL